MTTRYQKIILKLIMAILWRLIYKDMFVDDDFKQTYRDRHLKIIEDARKELDK